MQLPREIFDKLNLKLSCHRNPAILDWRQVGGEWVSNDGPHCYAIVHDTQLGYVVAEKKSCSYSVGADIL